MRVGFLGGVPPAFGGGGLELQIERTMAGMRERGHTVSRVADDPARTSWDLVHAFGSEGDVQHYLDHWTRSPAPLVMTPVLSTSPGVTERVLRVASRWPAPATHAALRRRALRRADALIATTAYERDVIRRLVGPGRTIEIVPNGVEPPRTAIAGDGPTGHLLLLGSVSELKGQERVIEALDGAFDVVVAGGFTGTPAARERWDALVRRTGTTWLGHVADRDRVAALVAGAAALVHLSKQEVQSLAVLEALAAGTRVIASDLPSHRELAASYPGWLTVVDGPEALPAAVRDVLARPKQSPPPAIPTWPEVAERIEAVYDRVLSSRS